MWTHVKNTSRNSLYIFRQKRKLIAFLRHASYAVLFSTKCCLFHNVVFSCSNMFFINHTLKFKYQTGNSNIKIATVWLQLIFYTVNLPLTERSYIPPKLLTAEKKVLYKDLSELFFFIYFLLWKFCHTSGTRICRSLKNAQHLQKSV